MATKSGHDDGTTKARILLYIANLDSKDFFESKNDTKHILQYIKKNYGSMELGGIRYRHLNVLAGVDKDQKKRKNEKRGSNTVGRRSYKTEKRLVVKDYETLLTVNKEKDPKSGRMSNRYILTPGFDNFTRLFNLFQKLGKVTDYNETRFMNTKYYNEFIGTEEFHDGLMKNVLMGDEDAWDRFNESKRYFKENIGRFEKILIDQEYRERYLKEVKEKGNEVYELEMSILGAKDIYKGNTGLSRLAWILKSSPSAMGFMLKIDCEEPLKSFLKSYFNGNLGVYHASGFVRLPKSEDFPEGEIFYDVVDDSPIYGIVRALFTYDLVHGKLVGNPIPMEGSKEFLSMFFKQQRFLRYDGYNLSWKMPQ